MCVSVCGSCSPVMNMPQATGLKRSSLTPEAALGLEIPLKHTLQIHLNMPTLPPCHFPSVKCRPGETLESLFGYRPS